MESLVYTVFKLHFPLWWATYIHSSIYKRHWEAHKHKHSLTDVHPHTLCSHVMTQQWPRQRLSPFSHHSSSFSQPSSLAVHITLQDSTGERNWGGGRRGLRGGLRGKGWEIIKRGMIGQMVCMCECAEIAQGKHRLAWELDHISTVPVSESAVTSACLLLSPPPLNISFAVT